MKSIMFLGVHSKTFRLTTDIKLESLHEYVHKRLQCNFYYDTMIALVRVFWPQTHAKWQIFIAFLDVVGGGGQWEREMSYWDAWSVVFVGRGYEELRVIYGAVVRGVNAS